MFDSLGLVLGRVNQIQQLTSQFQQVEQPAAPSAPVAAQSPASARVADDGTGSPAGTATGGAHRATAQGSFAEAFAAASGDSASTSRASSHARSASASRSTSAARATAASASAAAASHTMTAPAAATTKPATKPATKVSVAVGGATASGGFTPVTASSDTVGTVTPSTSYPALADLMTAGAATPPGIVAFDAATNQFYVTTGSQNAGGTIVPQGAASLASPSGDTYGLLQQLYAYENNPGLLDQQVAAGAIGSPASLPKIFTNPTERAWTIIQLAADVVTSGPAYYGQYAGLSNAQIIQAYDLYTKHPQLNLNPVLAGALTRAYNVAKQNPSGGFSTPLTNDQLKSAAATITVVDAGIMGQVVESHLP